MTSIKNQDNHTNKKSWFTISNIGMAVAVLFVLTIIFSPEAKGWVIQNLMKIGLVQAPAIPKSSEPEPNVAVAVPGGDQVTFADGKGKSISLAELKGKVVFVNFWATWCPPCIAEMPSIQALYTKYKDNEQVVFIMVDVDGKYKQASDFMKKNGYTLPVYLPESEVPKEYFAGSMPTTVILDKSGRLAFHHLGAADYSDPEITGFIDKLLK
ncbi:TlpA family protein disulfide reductase [Pedobacter sp. KBW06]|nr:TlpA family protein disulfide reductase [Pedobacter sp. KBW06]